MTLGALLVAGSGSVYSKTEIDDKEFISLAPKIFKADGTMEARAPDAGEQAFIEDYAKKADRGYAGRAFDLSKAAVGTTAKAAFATTMYAAEITGRYGVAYLTAYYGEELAVAGISKVAGGITTLMAGPVAGFAVEQGIHTLYKVTKYVPGLDGVAAVALTSTMKAFVTDPIINYGPSLAKSAAVNGYQAVTAVANKSYNALASAYSWWSGKDSQ